MNAKDLPDFLPPVIQSKVSAMIWGTHGIGKSRIVRDVTYAMFGEKNPDGSPTLIDLRLGQMEVGDLTGIPRLAEVDGEAMTVWGRPSWWPRQNTRGVLFIDEMNRASSPDVLQASFQLVLDHKLHTHKLPEGWSVLSANNPDDTEENYQVQKMDPALLNRFLHIIFSPTASDWNNWAEKNIKTWAIREFIMTNQAALGLRNAPKRDITPSPRSYEMLDKILSCADEKWINNHLHAAAAGLIGAENAVHFVRYIKDSVDRPIPPLDILDKWEENQEKVTKWAGKKKSGSLKNVRADLLKAQITSVFSYVATDLKGKLTKKQTDNLVLFMQLYPVEVLSSAFSELNRGNTSEKNRMLLTLMKVLEDTPVMELWTKAADQADKMTKTENAVDNPF